MKKFFLFATAAVALTVGCQKQELTNVDPLDNGELVPVTLGTNVSATAAVTPDTKAALKDLNSAQLYFYGFEQGAELNVAASYILGSTAGAYAPTPLTNDETLIKTGEYYADANYDFYGYHTDSATSGSTVYEAQKITIPVTITGQEDLLMAKTDKVKDIDASGKKEEVPLNRVYSAFSARRNVVPQLVFEHQLTQFTFEVVNGSNLPDDVVLKIDTIAVLSKTKGKLYIDGIKSECGLLVDDAGQKVDSLYVPATVGSPVESFAASDGVNAVKALDGKSVMVMPGEESYDLYMKLSQTGTPAPKKPSEPVLTIKQDNGESFLPGHSYKVILKVYSQEQIKFEVSLSDWEYGDDITIDPDDAPAPQASQLYATVASQTATSVTYEVNVPAASVNKEGEAVTYNKVEAALSTNGKESGIVTDWKLVAPATRAVEDIRTVSFEGLEPGKDYFCLLRYELQVGNKIDTVTTNTVADAVRTEEFLISKSYFVDNYKKSYEQLPATYRTAYGEWGTNGLSESLPWLAVEFTPCRNVDIKVRKNGRQIKTFDWGADSTDVEKKFTLATISAEELGEKITAGSYVVEVNGKTTIIEVNPFEIKKAYFVTENEESYNQLPATYRETYGDWNKYLDDQEAGAPNSLPWLAVEFAPTPWLDVVVKKDGTEVETFSYTKENGDYTLITLCAEELGEEITAGSWTVEINDVASEPIIVAE